MRWIAYSALVALTLVGCAPIWDSKAQETKIASLEKRVADLEKATVKGKIDIEERQQKLKTCVDMANSNYWAYMRTNGTTKKNGSVWAPTYVWEQARKNKEAQVQECQVLYGR